MALNTAQREAVEHSEGSLLVLAGAGSGKTRVITQRIVRLVEKGVAPRNILAVTFTNKAAREMRDRIGKALTEHRQTSVPMGVEASEAFDPAWSMEFPVEDSATSGGVPTITTFHSLGVRMLREYHERLGLSRHFTIHDRADTLRAVKRAIEALDCSTKEFEPKKVLGVISKAKGEGTTPIEFRERARSFGARMMADIWERYEAGLREAQALDFDDLLVKTRELLRTYPDVLRAYQDRFAYIHIDEFQDTNGIQLELARLLGAHGNICAVGDHDQSIYGFRGAKSTNILDFEKHFPGARTIMLEENYRSTRTIIEASNAVIAHNVHRPDKVAFTQNPAGEPILLHVAFSGKSEAEWIAQCIRTRITEGVSPGDVAILYRTNAQSRLLEEAVRNAGVPYQLLGTKFYDRAEVKDVLAYLRLAQSPENIGDLTRIINTPPRGIGKVSVEKIIAGDHASLTAKARAAYGDFESLLQRIREHSLREPLSEILRFIIVESGMQAHAEQGGDDGQDRLENMFELVAGSVKYDALPPSSAIEALLEESALMSDQDELPDGAGLNAVRLMTVHASKGLEFAHVFIAGMEEGLFPHQSFDERSTRDIEEERRLFYVALTRAKERIYLSYAGSRIVFGSAQFADPSRFLAEIPAHLIEHDAAAAGPSYASSAPKGKGLLDDWGDTIFI